MNEIYGLILTIIAGLFFLIGGLISLKITNKTKLESFSVALSFMVMLGLILFDLSPELQELLDFNQTSNIIISLIFVILGFIILKILDIFIPDHHHEHHKKNDNKKEHISHLHHIGLITIISLIFHNILEGGAIFGLTINNLKVGLLIALSVALHNIPLGTHIFSFLDIKENKVSLVLLTLSSFIGGLIFLLLGNINSLLLGIITSLTIGMLIYIIFVELFPELLKNSKAQETKIGLLLGLIIEIISLSL